MKKIKTLRRSLLCGLGVLSLAAVGCGGSGGSTAVVSPATLTLTNGTSNSVSRTSKSISKALAQLPVANITVDCFSLDGTLLDSVSNQSFPIELTLSDSVKSALVGDSVVFVARDTNGLEYKTTVKVDSIGSGPIKAADGSDLAEPVDAGSTAITQLVEQQLEEALGRPITLGAKASAADKAAIKLLTSSTKPVVNAATIGETFKKAAKTANSTIAKLLTAVKAGTQSPIDAIERPVQALRSTLNIAKKVTRASARLSGVAKSNPTLATQLKAQADKIAAILSTSTTIDKQVAGADSIATVADMAAENSTLFGASLTTLAGNTDLSTVVDTVISTVLPIARDNASGLGTLSDETANLLGTAMQTATAAQNTSLNDTFTLISQSVADGNSFAGDVLGSASGTTAGAARILNNIGANADLDLSSVLGGLTSIGGNVLENVLKATVDSGTANTDSLLASVVNVVDANDFAALVEDRVALGLSANAISDQAKIAGDASAKTGAEFTLFNRSIETSSTATYTYKWMVGSLATGTVAQTRDSVSFTTTATAGTYSVMLEQSKDATIVGTATHSVVVAATLKPVLNLSRNAISLVQGKSGVINVSAVDPETTRTGTLTVTATEVGSASALTLGTLSATGGSLAITAKTSSTAKTYNVKVTVANGSTELVSKILAVKVLALPDTKVSLFGVVDKIVGDSITLTALAVQAKAVTTGNRITIEVERTHKVAGGRYSRMPVLNATSSLSVGTTSLSTTMTNLQTGTYEVSAYANDGANTQVRAYKSFIVKEVGAPSFSRLKINGKDALEFPSLNFVGSTTNTSLSFVAEAAVAGSTAPVSYAIKSAGSILSAAVAASESFTGSTSRVFNIGTTYVIISAIANGETVDRALSVTYAQAKKLVVSSVTLAGSVVQSGSLHNSVANNVYVMDATNVEGVRLNTTPSETLYLDVATTTGTTPLDGTNYNFVVSLTDENNSARSASFTVANATVVSSNGGFDVTTAASLDFAGSKTHGSNATVSVQNVSTITNFGTMFSPTSNGMRINLLALKGAMKQILGSDAFVSSLDTLNGTDLTVMISITGKNFLMQNASGTNFTGFKAVKVKVSN